jgi:hypothetical protein
MINITKIYLVANIDNDPNKVYIGKTKNTSRETNHKRTFGNQITFDYIDEVNSLKYKDWEPLETYWIEQFKQWGFTVINKRKKGGSGPEYHTEASKIKMSIPIFQYDLKGNFIREWNGIFEASKAFNKDAAGIFSTCNNKQKTSCGYLWSYKKYNNPNTDILHKHSKPVLQYDKCNNIIKEWNSITIAGTELNIDRQSISMCCRNKIKSAGGFIWKFKVT